MTVRVGRGGGMYLEFTAEQEALRLSVREVLDRECPMSTVRAQVETGVQETGLWKQAIELGWQGLTLEQDLGGLGLGAIEVAVVAEELGRHVAVLPWLSTVTQYTALVRATAAPEQQQALLAPVAAGAVIGTAAIAENAVEAMPAVPTTRATRQAGSWRLDGTKHWVWDTSLADEIAVVARVADGLGVFVVPATSVEIRPVDSVDGSRQLATVVLDGVTVSDDRALGRPGHSDDAVRRALETATTAVAVETIGVCGALLDRTVDYVKTREQFGVPIGSFQAIKHKLADCYVALERARAAAYFASATLAEDDRRRASAVAMAKVAAGDCQQRIVEDAIQSHGGIGYTWEADIHLFVKRAKANAACFGTARTHRRALAAMLGIPAPVPA